LANANPRKPECLHSLQWNPKQISGHPDGLEGNDREKYPAFFLLFVESDRRFDKISKII
jgi:hypothetical protein